MKHTTRILLPAMAAAALLSAGAAQAEGFSYGGYFRGGPQFSKKDHSRTCFQAPGSDWKYRLGNECDYYGEFMLAYGIGKEHETQYNVYWMPNFFQGNVSDGSAYGQSANLHTEQMYVEIKSPDFAPSATFWGGTRFYNRENGDQNDTFYVNQSGTGAGMGLGLGGAMTFDAAVFRSDNNAAGTQPGSLLSLDVHGVPAGPPNSTLNFTLGVTKGDFTGGKNGSAFTVQHNLTGILGQGGNKLWLQYAQGSAGLNTGFAGSGGTHGFLTDGSDVKHYRIADNLIWQVTPSMGGSVILSYQESKCSTSTSCANYSPTQASIYNGSLKHLSAGVRPVFGITNNFKIAGEIAYDSVKTGAASGLGTLNMTKFTIAPTISAGPGLFSRPDLRFYVTSGHWNGGTNVASNIINGTTTGYGGLGGSTNGTSYGFQIETWW